jgi:hypothetical protein
MGDVGAGEHGAGAGEENGDYDEVAAARDWDVDAALT